MKHHNNLLVGMFCMPAGFSHCFQLTEASFFKGYFNTTRLTKSWRPYNIPSIVRLNQCQQKVRDMNRYLFLLRMARMKIFCKRRLRHIKSSLNKQTRQRRPLNVCRCLATEHRKTKVRCTHEMCAIPCTCTPRGCAWAVRREQRPAWS